MTLAADVGDREAPAEELHRERVRPGRVELRTRAHRVPEVLERAHDAHGDQPRNASIICSTSAPSG